MTSAGGSLSTRTIVRFWGILVRHHLTRRVAYGTIVRLVTMSVSAAVFAFAFRMPGALVGALVLLTGVVCEAFASRWMARPIVQSIVASDAVAEGTLLRQRDIARFYFPLALTSILSMALGPCASSCSSLCSSTSSRSSGRGGSSSTARTL